jgi:hypothetical protein
MSRRPVVITSILFATMWCAWAADVVVSGTVVDASGAALAGAAVELQSANRTVLKTTESDLNGSFTISGLPAGNYRLVISHADFATREIPVTIGAEAPTPFRISLALASVSSTVTVQGREDDLTGIAQSATQGTVGQKELEDRPILRSGEVLETVPGVIITQHAGGGKANQYFLRGFNLDHGTDFAVFLDGMPLNLPSHAHGEGYSDMNVVIQELVQRVNYEKGPITPTSAITAQPVRLICNSTRRCPRTSSRWKAACTAMSGQSSAFRKRSARAICSSAESSITTTAPGRIRIIIPS